jgi:hypothetical protein
MQASDAKKGNDIQTRGFLMENKENNMLVKPSTHNLI